MQILVVDDEPLVLAGLVRALGNRFELTTVSSAAAAFEVMAKQRFDAVVTDYLMPDVNGLALLQIVRGLYPNTRRVLMSAGVVPDLDDQLASGLVEVFLSKPFTEKDLVDALDV